MKFHIMYRCIACAVCLMSAFPAAAGAPREVNVTSDSVPGWIPSVEQSQQAENAAHAYLAAEDSGDADAAYKFFAAINKSHTPFDDYKTNVARTQTELGAVVERRFVKVTWTKDSPNAPMPGIYAAIDIASRFANAERHCGYLILYQPDTGGDFQIMREESNFIKNSAFADIAHTKSQAEADAIWAQLSANCPNYPGTAAAP